MPDQPRRVGPPEPAPSGGAVRLVGVVEGIIYSNEENHFAIAELKPDKQGQIVITGTFPGLRCGETLEVAGNWVRHPRYGDQLKVAYWKSIQPSSIQGIRKYLGSGLVPGIKKGLADRIVKHFGKDTLDVISHNSGRLTEVSGIGSKRAREIKEAWDAQQAQREVMVFLHTYGISSSHCQRIIRKFGQETADVLRENPYCLVHEIRGIGFKTADRIARNLGLANDTPQRLRAGIDHTLSEIEDEGHTACPPAQVVDRAVQLLEAPRDIVEQQLRAMLSAGDLSGLQTAEGLLAQLPATRRAEEIIRATMQDIARHPSALPGIKRDIAVRWAQEKAGFRFAPEQTEAVLAALASKCTIITGGPGTGKTTILKAITSIITAKKARVLLAAPTGRAAQKMADTTGLKASTIHRLLRFDPASSRFSANEDAPLPCDMLILDEASMLDTQLAAALLQALSPQAHLVLTGDVDQLPSVRAGNVLLDLMESGLATVIRLRQIFRQADQSGIVALAHAILRGEEEPPRVIESLEQFDPERDVQMIHAPDPEQCLQAICRLCAEALPASLGIDPVRDLQVIAPMHRGHAGIENINTALQKVLNENAHAGRGAAGAGPTPPAGTVAAQEAWSFGSREGAGTRRQEDNPDNHASGPRQFLAGDKVIQLRNDYEKGVFNGDLGIVVMGDGQTGALVVDVSGEQIHYERSETSDLSLAYAISVHKSQGSEFPVVLMPLLKQHFMMLQRNLLYTGLTRGRQKVVIVGSPEAWSLAVRNSKATRRVTGLSYLFR